MSESMFTKSDDGLSWVGPGGRTFPVISGGAGVPAFNPGGSVQAPDPAPAPAPAADVVSRGEFERLQRESQAHREAADALRREYGGLANLHPDDRRAAVDALSRFAAGDTDAAVTWMVDNARALAGTRFDEIVGRAVAAPSTGAPTMGEVTQISRESGMSRDEVLAAIEAAKTAARTEAVGEITSMQQRQAVDRELSSLGCPPGSPQAASLLTFAMSQPNGQGGQGVPIAQAYNAWREQQIGFAQQLAAQAPRSTPGQPQGGVPQSPIDETGMTAAQKIQARMARAKGLAGGI